MVDSYETSLHPISLLSRTDGDIITIFHSVFLINIQIEGGTNTTGSSISNLHCNNEISSAFLEDISMKVVHRIPQERENMNAIESGLEIFMLEAAKKCQNNEMFDQFVITTTDGSKYFAHWKGFNNQFFIAVSRIPLASFSRNIFQYLPFENSLSLQNILRTLCELPICPMPMIDYNIKLLKGSAHIKFSSISQVSDFDYNYIVMNIFNPIMLASAWESLILERKVLLVTSIPSILAPCCELLRKLILPFVIINTFVPLLPKQLIHAIEAPFPYLLGADINDVIESHVDLSETVVIDLDSRIVIPPSNKASMQDVSVPDNLLLKLLQDINAILVKPLGDWFVRVENNNTTLPVTATSYDTQVDEIVKLFHGINLSLMSARLCSIRALNRLPNFDKRSIPSSLDYIKSVLSTNEAVQSVKKSGYIGFDFQHKIAFGFMQLLIQRAGGIIDDLLQQYVPSWMEVDELSLSVYEYADSLPLIYVAIHDIESVSPSPLEPQGYVFELTIRSSKLTYHFTATDIDSRRNWIAFIEKKLSEDFPRRTSRNSARTPTAASNLSRESSKTLSKENSARDMNTIPLSNTAVQISSIDFEEEAEVNFVRFSPRNLMKSPHMLGLPKGILSEETDDLLLIKLRHHFMKTQMSSYFKHQIIGGKHDNEIKDIKVSLIIDDETNSTSLKTLLWKGNNIESILSYISDGKAEEFLKVESDNEDDEDDEKASTASSSKSSSLPKLFRSKSMYLPGRKKSQGSISIASLNKGNIDTQSPKLSAESNLSPSELSNKSKSFNLTVDTTNIDSSTYAKAPQSTTASSTRGLLRSMYSFGWSNDKNTVVDEVPTLKTPYIEIDAEQSYQQKSFKDLIANIRLSLTRTESECNKHIVDDRMKLFVNLLNNLKQKASNTIYFDLEAITQSLAINASRDDVMGEFPVDFPGKNWYERVWSVLVDVSTFEKSILSSHSLSSDELDTYASEEDIIAKKKIHTHLIEYISQYLNCSESCHLDAIYHVQLGYLHQQISELDAAIEHYTHGSLAGYKIITNCLMKQLEIKVASSGALSPIDIFHFIKKTNSYGTVYGLLAYRLSIELLYREVIANLTSGPEVSNELGLDNESHNANILLSSASPSSIFSDEQKLKLTDMFTRWNTKDTPSYTWVERSKPSDILNEVVICTELDNALDPCELTIDLLSKLREMLRDYCRSSGESNSGVDDNYDIQLKIKPGIFDSLLSSSAFRSFEVAICQFQKLNINGMTLNSRVVFFCNLYNIITVHCILVRSAPGVKNLERTAFMKWARYNVGGMIFSLADIEFGILRNSSSKPMMMGTYSSSTFSDKDPRKAFALEEAKPFVSFCLFTASFSSPVLTVLQSPEFVDEELKQCGKFFCTKNVKLYYNGNLSIIQLPQLFSIYWGDFGNKRKRVLKTVYRLLPSNTPLAEEIKSKVNSQDTGWNRADITFLALNNTPALLF